MKDVDFDIFVTKVTSSFTVQKMSVECFHNLKKVLQAPSVLISYFFENHCIIFFVT